jgi:hypothetical protein
MPLDAAQKKLRRRLTRHARVVATLLTLVFLPALYVAWFRIQPEEDTSASTGDCSTAGTLICRSETGCGVSHERFACVWHHLYIPQFGQRRLEIGKLCGQIPGRAPLSKHSFPRWDVG